MDYKILKDTSPEKTIENIKKILSEIGIILEEEILEDEARNKNNLFSLHVVWPGFPYLYANGKGSSLINAKASAYAEFIERLQNMQIYNWKLHSHNEIKVKKERLEEFGVHNYWENIDSLHLINDIVEYSIEKEPNKDISLVPFYNLKEDKESLLPHNIIRFFQTSNGMAAGNTKEEAMVQGLSEICERFACRKVFTENLPMPNIPLEKYMKYEKTKKIILFLEENGYSITVKDASIGLKLPVVCILLKNEKNGYFYVSFGAHPSLPIAIERSLTEFVQGRKIIEDKNLSSEQGYISADALSYYIKENKRDCLYQRCFVHIHVFEYCDNIDKMFYSENSTYEFSEKVWIDDDKNISNKELLNLLIERIKNYTDEIYVRDVSFLNFPAVYIFIPKMSECIKRNEEQINLQYKILNWWSSGINFSDSDISFEEFYKYLEHKFDIKSEMRLILPRYISLYCLFLGSIILNNTYNIEKYSKLILAESTQYKKSFISNVEIIKDYYSLKSSTLINDEVDTKLREKYSEEEIKKTKLFINNLSYEIIKVIVDKNKIAYISQEEELLTYELLGKLNSTIMEKYNANIPKQILLREYFY